MLQNITMTEYLWQALLRVEEQKINNIFNYPDDNFRSCYIILKNHDWWLFNISMKSFPERLSRTVCQRHKAKWLPFVTAESHEMIKKWREGFWWEENHTGFVMCTCIQERIQILPCHLKVKRVKCKLKAIISLTIIIPRARMGSESMAHETEGFSLLVGYNI